MALRTIITLGNPILRQKAHKVHRFDASLQRLIKDMFETLAATDNGIALAAPQIAQLVRVIVIDDDNEESGKQYKLALVNPEIVRAEGEQRGVDGCLSIPGYYGVNVRRADRVVVKGQDARGKPVRISAQGHFAWVLQHEIDHLDGILFIDRLDSPDDLRELRSDPSPVEAD